MSYVNYINDRNYIPICFWKTENMSETTMTFKQQKTTKKKKVIFGEFLCNLYPPQEDAKIFHHAWYAVHQQLASQL